MQDIEYDWRKTQRDIAINANRQQAAMMRKAAFDLNNDFEQDFLGAFQKQNQLAFDLREANIATGQSFQDAATARGDALTQGGADFRSTINNNQNH